MPKKKSKAIAAEKRSLALIGVDAGTEYWPSVLPTADGAHKLTQAILTLALHTLEKEREDGSELPDVNIVDLETGELTMNLAYEAMLRERALIYLQTMGAEGEASTFELLAEIEARSLYMWSEQPWESLGQFVRSLGDDRSPTYASVWERMASRVLPFLQVEKTVGVQEIMAIIVAGKKSNLYHLLPNMLTAVETGDHDHIAELLTDAKALTRSEIWTKYKDDKDISPAKAILTFVNSHWQLIIEMDETQKRVIMSRLGLRIKYE